MRDLLRPQRSQAMALREPDRGMTPAATPTESLRRQETRDGIATYWVERERAHDLLRELKPEYRMLYDLTAIEPPKVAGTATISIEQIQPPGDSPSTSYPDHLPLGGGTCTKCLTYWRFHFARWASCS